MLDPERTIILACDNLEPYLRAAQESMGTSFKVVTIKRNLHNEPENMKAIIADVIDEMPAQYETVLVAMGFCGGAWSEVKAPRRLVIPRADDCISLLLQGPAEEFKPCMKEPWRLYVYDPDPSTFTVGRMMDDVSHDDQYDGVPLEMLFSMLFGNYRHLDIIDTGLNDCYEEEYVMAAQAMADELSAELGYSFGSVGMLEALVSGDWDDRFVVAEKGEVIRHGTFFE